MNKQANKIILLIILAGTMANCINAQRTAKENVSKIWHLDKYIIESKEYTPPKKEKDDFIEFKEDMTFISKSEGKLEKGTWMLNVNGNYIEMMDENGEKLKVQIITLTPSILMVRFDIDEIREIEVRYTSL